MADKVSMFSNLRLKCAPMQNPESDRRNWFSDAYGFTDDFATPIEDADNGPYGPPAMRTTTGDTGRYAGSLLGVLARMQGYNAEGGVWRRFAVTLQGQQRVQVDSGQVEVTNTVTVGDILRLPASFNGSAGVARFSVGNFSTNITGAGAGTYFFRIDVPAGAGSLWVNLAGGPAVVGEGILVTPTQPLVMQWPCTPNSTVTAISTLGTTFANVTSLSR